MKVLFFYQHFWPDSPPYATMLRMLGAGLAKQGVRVSIITGQPSYKDLDRRSEQAASEALDGIDVHRLRRLPGSSSNRLCHLLGKTVFPLRACINVIYRAWRFERPDVIVAATMPPVINGLFGLLAARITGARFVYHLQDIYPEIGVSAGLFPVSSWRYRLLLAMDTWIVSRADRCIVLSEDMQASLQDRTARPVNTTLINNVMLEDFAVTDDATVHPQRPDSEHDKQDALRFVFAGNLGRFQGLDKLLSAFLQISVRATSLQLHFMGEGVMLKALRRQASNHPRVFFHPHQPFSQAAAFVERCDAGIVSIEPGVARFAWPSKTLTYLGLGVPVFVVVEPESALANTVISHSLGCCSPGFTIDAIAQGLNDMQATLRDNTLSRLAIREYFHANHGSAAVIGQWNMLLHDVCQQARTR